MSRLGNGRQPCHSLSKKRKNGKKQEKINITRDSREECRKSVTEKDAGFALLNANFSTVFDRK